MPGNHSLFPSHTTIIPRQKKIIRRETKTEQLQATIAALAAVD